MLEKAANYFLIGACIAFMAAMGTYAKRQLGGVAPRAVISSAPDFKVGQSAAKIDGVDASKPTLVLGISPTCSFCKRDIPIYQQLARTKKVIEGSVHMVTILPAEPARQATAFVTENRIPGAVRVAHEAKDFPFRGTPTILLLDEKHVVVWVWMGSLTPEAKNELMGRLG